MAAGAWRRIPFQAEIGEASIGSVAVGDTKESSLDAPGYFSAHVVALTYVDEEGELRTLSDHADGTTFHEFKCSFGLSGIVVECQLEVRPATLCKSDISIAMFKSPEELATGLIKGARLRWAARDRFPASPGVLFRSAPQGRLGRHDAGFVAAGLRRIPFGQAACHSAWLRRR